MYDKKFMNDLDEVTGKHGASNHSMHINIHLTTTKSPTSFKLFALNKDKCQEADFGLSF